MSQQIPHELIILAHEAMRQEGGNVDAARLKIAASLAQKPAERAMIQEALLEQAIEVACVQALRVAGTSVTPCAVVRQSKADVSALVNRGPRVSTVRGLVALAQQVSLDMLLSSGIPLGHATSADLLEEAVVRRKRAGDEWRLAKFFAVLSQRVNRGRVAEVMGQQELDEVFEESKHVSVEGLALPSKPILITGERRSK